MVVGTLKFYSEKGTRSLVLHWKPRLNSSTVLLKKKNPSTALSLSRRKLQDWLPAMQRLQVLSRLKIMLEQSQKKSLSSGTLGFASNTDTNAGKRKIA